VALAGRRALLVTGASGFLGRRLLEAVAARWPDRALHALVHDRPAPPIPGVVTVRGDLAAEVALEPLLEGVETIVHLAAVTHASRRDDYVRVNAEGTARLARAAARAGVARLVLVSSRAIRPECGDYARSKRAAEEAAASAGIPYVVLRLSEVYGEGSGEGLNALIGLVRRSPIVPYPAGATPLAPLLLDDAIDALLRVVARPALPETVYTLAGPASHGLRDIIRLVAEAHGLRRVAAPMPTALFTAIAYVGTLVGRPIIRYDQLARLSCAKDADITAAGRDLGFAPRTFAEGLRRLSGAST